MDRDLLQKKVLSGEVDADALLPNLVEYIDVFYYIQHPIFTIGVRWHAAKCLRHGR